ncbi:MAG: CHAT domain-containing protein [Saprospiraceae bacterium]|nr:CHAT domain-containing protein [Saprospiraceae bacterium]
MAFQRIFSFFLLIACMTFLPMPAQDQLRLLEDKIAWFEADFNPDSLAFYYRKKVAYSRQTDNLADWADAWFNWQYTLDDAHHEALILLDSAVQLAWRLPRNEDEAMALAYVQAARSRHLFELGKILPAVKAGEAALALYESVALYDPDALDYFYLPLIGQYTRLGDNEKARILCKKAIENHAEGPQDAALAGLYNNLGLAYWNDRDFENAIAAFKKGLQCRDISPIKSGLLQQSLAQTYFETGRIDLAETFATTAIAVLTPLKNSGFDQQEVADYLSGAWLVKAKLCMQQGRFAVARKYLQQALEEGTTAHGASNHRDLVKIQVEFGKLYLHTGLPQAAAEAFHAALCSLIPGLPASDVYALPAHGQLYEENTIYEALEGKADALQALHGKSRQLTNLKTALDCHQLAGRVESMLRHALQYESSKISLLSQSRLRIEKAIDIARELWEATGDMRYIYTAWANAEQAKSALLLEAVQRNRFDALIAGDTLLSGARTLRQQIASLERLMLEEPLSPSLSEWTLQRDALIQQLTALEARLQQRYPAHSEFLRQTESISGASIRAFRDTLPNHTLIEYFAGDDYVEVFGQSPNGRVTWKRISNPDSLAAKTQQFLSLLQSRKAMEQANAYRELAYLIYRDGLLPVLESLNLKSGALLLIPDAWLANLPFEALLDEPAPQEPWERAPFLLRRYSVQYAFSLAVLESQRRLPSKAEGNVLQVAPRFSAGQRGLPPLIQSSGEAPVEEICKSKLLIDAQADFKTLRFNAPGFRILHLSTHAGIDTGGLMPRVELFDRSALLPDIYALQLQADLVVLSACQTGLGQFRKGEGVMSLSRAFTYAGAKGLISSLWTINEAATTNLLRRLYQGLTAGEAKAEALRHAKLGYLDDPAIAAFQKSPYYWAGLVYLGDEGAVELRACWNFRLLIWPVLLILAVMGWLKRKTLLGK